MARLFPSYPSMILNRRRNGGGKRHGTHLLPLMGPQARMVKERKALERVPMPQAPPRVMEPAMELDSKTRAACKKRWLSSLPRAAI